MTGNPPPRGIGRGLRDLCGSAKVAAAAMNKKVEAPIKKGYHPPPVRREIVDKLVQLYKKKRPEEFIRPGYPQKPPENLPPS